MQAARTHTFSEGVRDGFPIFLGYFSVSFGFGVLVVRSGLSAFTAVVISATNVTSAGQLAGLGMISAGSALAELIAAEVVINIRYSLMSISLTQKLDSNFGTVKRMICGFGITDEIFAVAVSKPGLISASYFSGLMSLPLCGWLLGTAFGALAGGILPTQVQNALGIMLYAMFIAIVLPEATKNRAVAVCAAIAVSVSCALSLIPVFSFLTSGFSVVVSALLASVPTALLFPVQDKEQDE